MTDRSRRVSIRRIALLLGLSLAAGCAARQEPAARLLSEQERLSNVETFDQIWTTIHETYPDPKKLDAAQGGVDWAGAKDELRPRVAAAPTQADARGVMGELIARLGESHFGVIPADAYAGIESRPDERDGPSGNLGIGFRRIGDQVVVARVAPGSGAEAAGVKPGWVIESVQGRKLAETLARVDASGMSGAELASILVVNELISAPLGEKLPVTFRDDRDRRRKLNIPAGTPEGREVTFGNLPPMRVRTEARTLEGGVGYYSLSLFFDAENVMKEFGQFVKDHQDAPGLVIDLRGNLGGIGLMSTGLAGFLVQEPGQKLGTMITRDTRLNFVVNPRRPNYAGPVALLVDEMSLSTSEIMAGGLQDIGRAKVFGSRTSGAALPSLVVNLPNGDRLQYAHADYLSEGGQRLEGHGVVPDVVVEPDRASLLAGKDVVLDAALAWIASGAAMPTTSPAVASPAVARE